MSTKIYVWPDNTWCFEDEYPYLMDEKSDDFRVIELSNDFNLDTIDDFVYKLNRNKL